MVSRPGTRRAQEQGGEMPKKVDPKGPATGPTVKLLVTLATERVVSDEMKLAIAHEVKHQLTQGCASALIDYLKLCNRTVESEAARVAEGGVTEPGYYRHDGVLYQVVRAKAGHLYPVNVQENEFAKGVFPRLRASERVTELDVDVA
jgi:hypothetical protein